MKLTKKLGAEILKAYHTIWNAYLKGDMRVFSSVLDDKCYIIGSAPGEVFTDHGSMGSKDYNCFLSPAITSL